MIRPLRIEYPGDWYHVMSRDRRSKLIFSDQKDYHRFVDLLKESRELMTGYAPLDVSLSCLENKAIYYMVIIKSQTKTPIQL